MGFDELIRALVMATACTNGRLIRQREDVSPPDESGPMNRPFIRPDVRAPQSNQHDQDGQWVKNVGVKQGSAV